MGHDAAIADARDDRGDLFWVVLATGDVVKEEERFGAAANDIVDAHGDAVDADGVMLVHEESDLEFGANAIGS